MIPTSREPEPQASARIFLSHEWGQNSKALLRGVIALGPLFILARALSSAGQIIAGRWLGPSEFGLANLAVAAAGILMIPMQLGFSQGMIKFASMEDGVENQVEIVSTAFWSKTGWSFLCAAALIALEKPLAHAFHIGLGLYRWSLAYCFFLTFYSFLSSIPQAVLRFKLRGFVELCYGAAALAGFFILYFFATKRFPAFLGSLILAVIAASLPAAIGCRKWLKPVFNSEALSRMASYFPPALVYACAGAAAQAAIPLVLSAYLSPESVGVLSAYRIGSLGIAGALSQIPSAVLGPLTTRPERQKGAWAKFFLISPAVFIASGAFFAGAQYAVLRFIGRGYPIHPLWIALFASAAAFLLLSNMGFVLLGSRDAKSFWAGSFGVVLSGAAALAACFWAVPRYGLAGAGAAMTLSYAAGFAWYAACGWLKIKRGLMQCPE
ncbi:MAG: lipopolysaccharide biosynthesis protein [Elusimicrobiota bacterium]